MLGNDVVDLQDPDTRPESFRPRFDARVFDPTERRAIARDADPHRRRWAHWAAKEAAYKLARQCDAHFVFRPGQLVVRFTEGEAGEVDARRRHATVELPEAIASGVRQLVVRSDENADRVHVLAGLPDVDWDAVVSQVDLRDAGADERSAVRALAVDVIARDLGIEAQRVSIGRRGPQGDPREGRIPTVEIDGARAAFSLSLSHHGRFVACAAAPGGEVLGGATRFAASGSERDAIGRRASAGRRR